MITLWLCKSSFSLGKHTGVFRGKGGREAGRKGSPRRRVSPSQPGLLKEAGGHRSSSWLKKPQRRGLKEGGLDSASTRKRMGLREQEEPQDPSPGFPTCTTWGWTGRPLRPFLLQGDWSPSETRQWQHLDKPLGALPEPHERGCGPAPGRLVFGAPSWYRHLP